MKRFRRNISEETITFRAQDEYVWEVHPKPQPASKYLPDWWKGIPHYSTPLQEIQLLPQPNVTVKRCLSAFDALASGYIVPLWADVQVISGQEDGSTFVRWNTGRPVVSMWSPEQVSSYELPDGYDSTVFKYLHRWTIKTPPGWSSLITHPTGYPNLPFKVIPGIVDTDLLETDINTPFVIKKGFNGIIEAGTPMFQIIPIKRSDWKSNFVLESPNQFSINQERLRTKIISYYGRYMRKPKRFQ